MQTDLCNENQLDALFILSLYRHSTSTCFGHICSPSWGGTLYICNNWYVLCFSVDCQLASPANRHSTEKHNTYQLLYAHSVPPDDGLQIYPKHVEVGWQNKRRINSVSSWFLLHRCIEMHGQHNIRNANRCLILCLEQYGIRGKCPSFGCKDFFATFLYCRFMLMSILNSTI